MKIDRIAGGVRVLAVVLLSCAMHTEARAQSRYDYAIVVGPALSIDGFSPSSLNESVEVVYADDVNDWIATSTDTLALAGDMIDGETLAAIVAGSGTSINDNGDIVFRGRYGAGNFDAIFTPTSVIAKQWDNLTGMLLGFVGPPSINDSGHIVYDATVCVSTTTCLGSAIFQDRNEVLRTPFSDGFVEVTSVTKPVINDAGVIALYGRAFLADTSAIYLQPVNGPLVRIVHTGETVAPGMILDNPAGEARGPDLNENGDIATCWNTEAGDWVVLKNANLVAKAGDVIDGIPLTDIINHRPAINDDGHVAFYGRFAGGDGVFTQTASQPAAVLLAGQQIGSQTILFVGNLAINNSGVIATHVVFDSGLQGIVVATPRPTNYYAQMTTGSSVALRQNVDVPSSEFAMRVDHRFTTNTGQLNVRLDGVSLGSVGAPSSLSQELARVTFGVSGALLGRSDVTLELELDGPTGSTLEVDNVFLPDIMNGTFQSGSLAGWTAVVSGAGSVEVVPEPSATLAWPPCLLALLLGQRLRRDRGRGRRSAL